MRILIICIALLCSTESTSQVNPPYSTSFEGAVGTLNTNFPDGWTWEDLNTIALGNQEWQIIKNSPNAQNARTDSTAAHMFSHSSQANDDWLYTPGMQCEAGVTYNVSFWFSRAAAFPSTEKLALHVGADPTHSSMGTAVWQNNAITNGQYQQANVTWVAPSSGVFYFGFHYFSDAFQFILLLDDVSVTPNTNGISGPATEPIELWIANDRLHMRSPSARNYQMSAVDVTGRELLNGSINNSTGMDLLSLPNGTYLFNVVGPNGKSAHLKLVLQR